MLNLGRIRLRFCIIPLIFCMITVYFSYHLIEGERGIFRLFEVNREIKQAQELLNETNKTKERLEKQVELLSSAALNEEMLDETIRKELGHVEKNEYVIFD